MQCTVIKPFKRRGELQYPGSIIEVFDEALVKLAGYVQPLSCQAHKVGGRISGAFAAKLDEISLATILADINVPVSSVSQDPASWQGVLSAVASGMVFNQGLPTALISNPADMILRASELAETGGTWLGRPALLDALLELSSNGLDAGTAIIGHWALAVAVAVRSQLQLEIVRFAKPGSHSHLLVASARIDSYVMQPNGLFIMEKAVSA